MKTNLKTITIFGVGLIGGSFALKLRSQFPNMNIIGVDHNQDHCKEALALNIVDEIRTAEEQQVLDSDLILFALPVNAIVNILPGLLSNVSDTTIVIDAGSTKSEICKSVAGHPRRKQFVAAHPIAGTEYSGPKAAFSTLYEGKKNIICEFDHSGEEGQKTAIWLFESLGMHNLFMDADSHDKHLAYVSHLSHISSFMLGLTVLNIEKDEENILNLAGSGFESTVRLAKSSPDMWSPIFIQNRKYLSKALEEYIHQLQNFQKELSVENNQELKSLMQKSNEIRKVIK